MDKLEKKLRKMKKKERLAILLLMMQIKKNYKKVPGLQAIKGVKDTYRVRMGNYRIIFKKNSSTQKIEIIGLRRRNESTYKDL